MTTSWRQRILDLEESGLSLTTIAEKVGLGKSTISGIKSGATKAPTGDAAVDLYLLHKRRCKSGRRGKQVA
jgi:transcriptional regulator with XRE-family HTH domain